MRYLAHVAEVQDKNALKAIMGQIGVHKQGIDIMSPKSLFKTVRVDSVPVTSANIIKQEMLARGGDVATTYGAVNHSVKKTDILIFGSEKQFSGLLQKGKSLV